MKITIARSWEKQEEARVQRMEGLRRVEQLNNMLLGKIKVHSVSKKAHLRVRTGRFYPVDATYTWDGKPMNLVKVV